MNVDLVRTGRKTARPSIRLPLSGYHICKARPHEAVARKAFTQRLLRKESLPFIQAGALVKEGSEPPNACAA